MKKFTENDTKRILDISDLIYVIAFRYFHNKNKV